MYCQNYQKTLIKNGKIQKNKYQSFLVIEVHENNTDLFQFHQKQSDLSEVTFEDKMRDCCALLNRAV